MRRPSKLVILLFIVVFGYLNRDFVEGWFSHVLPAPAGSIRGEWVGKMQISGIYVPNPNPDVFVQNPQPVHKDAVIRFKLSITDSFLKKYGGRGELTIAGEKPQAIEVKDLWPENTPGDDTLRTGIWVLGPADGNDPVSGGFDGTFKPGTLTLKRTITVSLGYVMDGVLHKGSDADYQALVGQLAQRIDTSKQ